MASKLSQPAFNLRLVTSIFFQTCWQRYGWPLFAALALGAAALGLWGLGLPTLQAQNQNQLAQQKSQRAELAQRSAEQHTQALSMPQNPAPALFAPPVGAQENSHYYLQQILQKAADSGLQARQGEYRLSADKTLGLATYRLTLPLLGTELALRQFVAQVHRELPFAALTELSFKRASALDMQAEARSVWLLYLQDAP